MMMPVIEPVVLHGEVVRLEPLGEVHVEALALASAEDPRLYQWSQVPIGDEAVQRFVAEALAGQDEGHMLPFAIIGLADARVLGSTRLLRIERWDWPPGNPYHGRTTPDVCEIGHTWLARSAIRTRVNTDAKRLLLTHAFETWQVHRVCLRTDVRNERSRAAIERLGARLDGIVRGERAAVDGTVRDSALYSIVASEWPAAKRRLEGLATPARAPAADR
jgi:RimJ/RimL family protein N-acetyltransferase